jgi:hypothetical protein
MARSSECTESYAQKVIDTADIVRDAILCQLRSPGFLKGRRLCLLPTKSARQNARPCDHIFYSATYRNNELRGCC